MEEINKEEIKKAIAEAKEKMEKDKDLFGSERKAALTWNIIFFIGILSTTITISLLTKSEKFNIGDLFNKGTETTSILASIFGLLISFLVGILGSFYKSKKLKGKNDFEIDQFLKEAYLNRIEKSVINPQKIKYD
jgi:hypothetical protein